MWINLNFNDLYHACRSTPMTEWKGKNIFLFLLSLGFASQRNADAAKTRFFKLISLLKIEMHMQWPLRKNISQPRQRQSKWNGERGLVVAFLVFKVAGALRRINWRKDVIREDAAWVHNAHFHFLFSFRKRCTEIIYNLLPSSIELIFPCVGSFTSCIFVVARLCNHFHVATVF